MQLLRREPHHWFLTPGPAELVLVRPLEHQHTRPIKELQFHLVETAIAEHGVIAAQREDRLVHNAHRSERREPPPKSTSES